MPGMERGRNSGRNFFRDDCAGREKRLGRPSPGEWNVSKSSLFPYTQRRMHSPPRGVATQLREPKCPRKFGICVRVV